MASDYPTILQIVPIPATSTKLQHNRVQGIVTSLTELGYDSLICTYPQSKKIADIETLHTKSKQQKIRRHDELAKVALSTNIKLFWLSLKAYRDASPIAIHTYGFRGLFISALIKTLFLWRKTALICDLSEEECAKLNVKSRFGINALFIKCTNIVLCPTQAALETTQSALKLDSKKVALVVNGINSNAPLSDERIATISSKLKLDTSKTIIAINDNLEKNSDALNTLQNILSSLKETKDKIHFLIVGEQKKYLYRFLKKNDIRSMCSFVGPVAPKLLPQYYSVCDIALGLDRAASDENRVNVLNFMANALPVLAFETRLNSHYLSKGSLFSRSDSDITDNLKNLIGNNQWQEKLALQNIQRFEEHYSWEISKEQLYSTYTQALS